MSEIQGVLNLIHWQVGVLCLENEERCWLTFSGILILLLRLLISLLLGLLFLSISFSFLLSIFCSFSA